MGNDDPSHLEKFAQFVSKILTVTKEDITKAEKNDKAVIRDQMPESESGTEECP
jgi:hypothetical protein